MKSARLYICGLGLYEAYFLGENKENPKKIGEEYLTPYCNNYERDKVISELAEIMEKINDFLDILSSDERVKEIIKEEITQFTSASSGSSL